MMLNSKLDWRFWRSTCWCLVLDSTSHGITVYDGILSESLIILMLIQSTFAVACIKVLFAHSLFVDKLAMYSSSPSVTKFLHLSGFSVTSFAADSKSSKLDKDLLEIFPFLRNNCEKWIIWGPELRLWTRVFSF